MQTGFNKINILGSLMKKLSSEYFK